MNNVSGVSIAFLQEPDSSELALRLNQRVVAEVLQVSKDYAILTLHGFRVVARLTSPYQAAYLEGRRQARFIVKRQKGRYVELQLIAGGGETEGKADAGMDGLLPALLKHLGLPPDEPNQHIVSALVEKGVDLSAEVVSEIRNALEGKESWGKERAEAAARLKAVSLPVTEESLSLAQATDHGLGKIAARLMKRINQAPGKRAVASESLPAEAIRALDGLSIKWSGDAPLLVQGLEISFPAVARTLEGELAALDQGANLEDAENLEGFPLLRLALIRHRLWNAGLTEAAEEIDAFFEHLGRVHLGNIRPEKATQGGSWVEVELPVWLPGGAAAGVKSHREWHTARMRIASEPEGDDHGWQEEYFRIQIEMELLDAQSVCVDLLLMKQVVRARISTPSPWLLKIACEAMPTFQEAIESLGYRLDPVHFEVDMQEELLSEGRALPHEGDLDLQV